VSHTKSAMAMIELGLWVTTQWGLPRFLWFPLLWCFHGYNIAMVTVWLLMTARLAGNHLTDNIRTEYLGYVNEIATKIKLLVACFKFLPLQLGVW